MFHVMITTIASRALEDLYVRHQLHSDRPDDSLVIHYAFLFLISEFNGVLPLDYPFLVVGAHEHDRVGVVLKAMYRDDIPALREATNAKIIPVVDVDHLIPGPLPHIKTINFRYENFDIASLPDDPCA